MASDLTVGIGLAGMFLLAASVLGTVDRRERFAFVAGVVLVLVGLSVLDEAAAGPVALVGLLVVLASTVPMLRE